MEEEQELEEKHIPALLLGLDKGEKCDLCDIAQCTIHVNYGPLFFKCVVLYYIVLVLYMYCIRTSGAYGPAGPLL